MSGDVLTSFLLDYGISPENLSRVSFRDKQTVYLSGVRRPAFLCDRSLGTRLKYGEYDEVVAIWKDWVNLYRSSGFGFVAEDLVVVELPSNQALIDLLFQSDGILKDYLQRLGV